jgi:hypothetical protein
MLTEDTISRASREATIKLSSPDKKFLDQLIEYLKLTFNCKTTSPKMYSAEKDVFFQYITVSGRT